MKELKHLNLKMTHAQHKNLEIIAAEYGMTKAQVAIACIDLGCQSIGKINNLRIREVSGLYKAFAAYVGDLDLPEILPQDENS